MKHLLISLATTVVLMGCHSVAYSPPSSDQCVLILEHYRNWIFVPNGDTSNQRAVWQHVTEDGQLDPKGFLYWFPPADVWSVGWDPHDPVESHRYGYISAGKSSICPDDGLSGFFWIDGKAQLASHLHQALPESWTTCLPQDGRLTGSSLTPFSVGQTNSLVECARAALEANKRTTGVQWQGDTKACSGTAASNVMVSPGDGSEACLLTSHLLPGKAIGGGMGTFDLKLVKESVAKAEDCGSHVSAAESDADGMSYDEETEKCYAAFNMTSVNVKATGGKWHSAFLVQGIRGLTTTTTAPHTGTTGTVTSSRLPVAPAKDKTGVILGASIGGIGAVIVVAGLAYAFYSWTAGAEDALAPVNIVEAQPEFQQNGELDMRDVEASFTRGVVLKNV